MQTILGSWPHEEHSTAWNATTEILPFNISDSSGVNPTQPGLNGDTKGASVGKKSGAGLKRLT